MPMITIPLSAGYDTITRRVAQSVARDVMVLCNIDESTPVFLPGEFNNTSQPEVEGASDKVSFNSYDRFEVEAIDTLKRASALSMNIMSNEEPPVFEDRKLGLSVRPIYFESDLTLNIKYIANTRQKAEKWIKQMILRFSENRGSLYHEVTYDAPIHEGLLGLLAHIHERREKIAGYGETFPEYFNKIRKREITCLGARDGDLNKLMMIAPEQQTQITGYFNFDDIPPERKVEDNVTWEIEFSYRVLYKRWTHFYVVYPSMVHQQWLSRKYFESRSYYSLEEVRKRGPIGVRAMDGMDGYMDSFPPPVDGIRFPGFDEWTPPRNAQPPYSVPGITWLLQLNPDDPQDLLNLSEIPDVRFTLEMDTYFRKMYKTLNRRGGGSCFFTLFRDDLSMSENVLTIDSMLNVRATVPLDLRYTYHLRLSFCTNYPMFSNEALRSMEDNAVATLQAFQTILPTLDVEDGFARLIDEKYMTAQYIEWFYGYLKDHSIGFDNGAGNEGGAAGGRDSNQDGINTGLPGGLPSPYGEGPDGSGGSGGSGGIRGAQGGSGGRYVQFLAIVALRREDD